MEKELRAEQAAEQYQCCGLLQQDLTELCARAGIISIPRVTVRPFPAAAEGAEPHRLGEHCIQVELQNDDPRSVCGVFLRGWKVEEEMLGVLSKCLPALGNLKTLNLWSTGLTDCMLPALGTMVASCSQLWSLTLEGNPLPENSFHVLMGASSTLSHLSLRNNCIDDTAAQLLGQGLSTMSSSNHSLLSLVLSFNCISDVGAGHIAEGLRWNRSLLSLSLAHNRIGDIGAQKLAEVLQPFKLRHEEVVERRRLLMEAQGQPRAAAPSGGYAPSLRGSDAAVRLSPAKQSKSTTKKKERLRKEDVKQSKKLTAPSDPRPGRSRGTKGVSEEKQSTQALHPAEPTHPLLEPGLHRDGHVILPGNRVLLNLNLAHNRITERGLGALLAAVEGQQQQEGAGGQQGLRRLSLHRNSFPTACAAFTRLQELLQQRDPLPQPAEDEEEHSLEP
ncbi:leucine-rich repeat-containing protein 71 isoform X2 [Gallus gallus]|uniref:leucine-rich repeat-containing protein 71 isoform X2 n=1 Tax=Gallus gallus TaxID=9031 RepID=UPI00085ABA86|nr:leucine-rich repeat-containing protein 71 isoform X2 [Gallus gallus]XP_040546941.1 leucine-rich repeat-containing protein 71 isoform X2 [Gallus gallus]|eukprot:XP_024999305.1 leucine-rich repeat-containing protein 71 isoform X6 [Gallus gallus]